MHLREPTSISIPQSSRASEAAPASNVKASPAAYLDYVAQRPPFDLDRRPSRAQRVACSSVYQRDLLGSRPVPHHPPPTASLTLPLLQSAHARSAVEVMKATQANEAMIDFDDRSELDLSIFGDLGVNLEP